ncbi:MAG TPA: hypothetical protein PKZ42_08405 [Syntrophales bacterium]|nr:hypothetical protein [Syntrophales bacterium]
MAISNARRLKVLEEKNRNVKHRAADLSLDNRAIKEPSGKTSNARSKTNGF